ncbi:hypothetical protein [Xenorhabdus eapokensis]|uniref:Uncharacterized protein n=1 Tax=Xenorhabdus eapokensis TaxID=1873482 RepID=A0A1Q5TGL0_9GAMM|nr:hypothetical protein [Xenorhabdus eapokensis]OKO99362.1 hypothetical protein Xedl_03709 [Xenorhabdus eapokensis]
MTSLVILCHSEERYLEVCDWGQPFVPVLIRKAWARKMVVEWCQRTAIFFAEDAPMATPTDFNINLNKPCGWHNIEKLTVAYLSGDQSALVLAKGFQRLRSASMRSFVSWEEMAKWRNNHLATHDHLVVVSIDKKASMRDLSLFNDLTGFIVVNSLELGTFILTKTVVYSCMQEGEDICFAPTHKGIKMRQAAGLKILPADSEELTNWSDLICGTETIVSVIGHASEDYIRLSSDELICGRITVQSPSVCGKRLPTCMVNNDCFLPDLKRLTANVIPGRVFFANACLTLKVGKDGIFDGDDSYTISQRFLEGNAAVYVASPLLKDGRIEENLVFHGLMGAGMTVGQTVRELNRILPAWGLEVGKVMILGDPSLKTCSKSASESITGYKKGLVFGIRDQASNLSDELCYLNGAPKKASVAGFIRSSSIPGSPCAILDCNVNHVNFSELTIVERGQSPEQVLSSIREVLDEYDRVALLGIKISEGRQLLTDLRNTYPNLVRRASSSRCGGGLDGALVRALERVEKTTSLVDRGIVAKLQRETNKSEYHFVEGYRDAYRVLRTDPLVEGCPNCRSDAIRYQFSSLDDASAQRWMVSCVVCGTVQDGVPNFIEGRIIQLENTINSRVLHGKMLLHNTGLEETIVAVGGAVTHGRRHDASVLVPNEQVRIGSGGDELINIEIRVPCPADRHCMYLRMYFVSLGRIGFCGREFFV